MQTKTINARPSSVGAFLSELRGSIGQKRKTFCARLSVDVETLRHIEEDGKAPLHLFFDYLKHFNVKLQLIKGSETFKVKPIGNNAMISDSKGDNWQFMKHTDYEDFDEFCQSVYQADMKFLFAKPTAQIFTPDIPVKATKNSVADLLPAYEKLSRSDMAQIHAITKGRGSRVAEEKCSHCGAHFRIGWEYRTIRGGFIALCSQCHGKYLVSGYNGPIIYTSMGGSNKSN